MFFRDEIAIDLGTTYSVVASRNRPRPQFIRVASSIALDAQTQRPIAFGDEAKTARGRRGSQVTVVPPVERGVISRLDLIQDYLDYLLQFEESSYSLLRRIYLCAPWGATPVELQSYLGCLNLPRTDVKIIREPFAAALGAGLDVYAPNPVTIADIGGGTFEVSTMYRGHMAQCGSIRFAGVALDQMIQSFLREKKNVLISLEHAEWIKQHHLKAMVEMNYNFEVSGHCRFGQKPIRVEVSVLELHQALLKGFQQFEETLRRHLLSLPGDLRTVIESEGIHLSGGGALLSGLPDFLSERLQIPVFVVKDPLYAVIRGMLEVIEEPHQHRGILQISEQVA